MPKMVTDPRKLKNDTQHLVGTPEDIYSFNDVKFILKIWNRQGRHCETLSKVIIPGEYRPD